MAHPLFKFYSRLQDEIAAGMKRSNVVASCKRGCAHCCYIMTAIHAIEGQYLAQAVMKMNAWKDIAQRCRANALKLEELGYNRLTYFGAYQPCPLLSTERQECLVYDARPACCRFYMVVSDPMRCAPENKQPNIQVINTSEAEAMAMKACIELTNGTFIVAPISLMVLFSMPKAARNAEDTAWLRELTQGLPDPVQWMKQNVERHEEWRNEDPDAVKTAYGQAFQKVFGL